VGSHRRRRSPFRRVVSLFLPHQQKVTVYDKRFRVLEVEYNRVNVVSCPPLKERVAFLLSRLGIPRKFLAKLQRPERNFFEEASVASSSEILKVYFWGPYSFDDLTNFSAVLVDERGNTFRLALGARFGSPQSAERYIVWRTPRGSINPNSAYRMRIMRSKATNVVALAEIRLGMLGGSGKK
jgi:hypothetical protein